MTTDSKTTKRSKHHFVCGGAGGGEFTRWFLSTPLGQLYEWQVHEFEPANGTPALWTYDGEIEFYVSSNPESSTLIAEKKTGAPFKPKRIPCIDFSQWLRNLYKYGDFIIVALNVEGAEYPILDKIIADGTHLYISRLYIEFHNTKVGVSPERDKELVRTLEATGIPVEPRCLLCPNSANF